MSGYRTMPEARPTGRPRFWAPQHRGIREPESAYATPDDAQRAVQVVVDAVLRARPRPRVLEAGAGKRTRLQVPDSAHVVGVDTDAVAIQRNVRLNERIVADLGLYAAPAASFDLITCWYVLEHVDSPQVLLDRFATWAAPGGLVVIAVPHLASLKAMVTKLTPHRFHVWFKRHLLGARNAGKAGYGPYPTTLRGDIAPHAMAHQLAQWGFAPIFEGFFEDAKQVAFRHRIRLTGSAWRGVCGLVRVASLGRLDAAHSEYLVVFRRSGS
jgi:SAM-dependent methyltransferase